MKPPEFDFSEYDPKKGWFFPAQRLLRFAYEAHEIVSNSRKKLVFLHRYPDFRFVVYHELSGFCSALQNTTMLIRAHERQPAWWESQPEVDFEVNAQLADVRMQQVRHQATLGFVQSFVRQLDQAMRHFYKALNKDGKGANRKRLSWVWEKVLEECGRPEYGPLLKLWLVMRDCLSTQEKFRPFDEADLHIRYRGKSYRFSIKEDIDYQQMGFLDFWEMCLFLISEVDDMLMGLIMSKPMQAIPMIKTPYID